MKKLLSFVAVALLGLSTTFAQTTAPAQTVKKTAKKVETKATTTVAGAKKETKAAATQTVTSTKTTAAAVKKDGTPDMRFKENKAKAAAAAGPLKKDGTADMRYKANKKTTVVVKKN